MTGIAILGAGIFAREQHIPAINAVPSLSLKAIYSRSQSSAESLLEAVDSSEAKSAVTLYHDSPSAEGKALSDLLTRDDISAVVVCLPILVQPEIIKRALKAGKHVLSEKPIAKDLATARDLIEWHHALAPPNGGQKPIWAVAENFRYMDAVTLGAEKLRDIGGEVVTFSVNMANLVADDSKYYNTPWRKTPEYQGGFLLDGGIHFVAALRLLLTSLGQGNDIRGLSARSALLQPRLAPVDTVHALLTTGAGASGNLAISFGTEFKSGLEFQVVTTNGAVAVTPVSVEVTRKGEQGGEPHKEKIDVPRSSGVRAEVEAFASSVESGQPDAKQSVEEALRDLEVLEGMLTSGAKGGEFATI